MTTHDVPWDKLGVPPDLRARVSPAAPREARLAVAREPLLARGGDPEGYAAALYVLATQDDAELRQAALEAAAAIPGLAAALTQRAHPKVVEFLAEARQDDATLERILQLRNTNDRTAILLARRAGKALCEAIVENHERLLITPEVLVALHGNPACTDAQIERAVGFLRMNNCLPALPETRGAPPPPPPMDLEAEIAAALAGQSSPMLEAKRKLEMFELDHLGGPLVGFEFDFQGADDFSLDLLEDRNDATDDERLSLAKKVAALSVGKKIKLAYLGNKEVRAILIRDRSKMVASAVVKSGRLTDSEVAAYAGNRNLHTDVLREIAMNKEWMRKYPVQVSLVNNPRCPPSVGVGIVNRLQQKELEALGRNRNVSSVVFQAATKLLRERKKTKT